MLKPKKVPLRKCLGCQQMLPKRELVRVVKSPAGVISLDKTGKSPGRGAYVCPQLACLKKAQKARAFERGLETAIDPSVYAQLEAQLQEAQE